MEFNTISPVWKFGIENPPWKNLFLDLHIEKLANPYLPKKKIRKYIYMHLSRCYVLRTLPMLNTIKVQILKNEMFTIFSPYT